MCVLERAEDIMTRLLVPTLLVILALALIPTDADAPGVSVSVGNRLENLSEVEREKALAAFGAAAAVHCAY